MISKQNKNMILKFLKDPWGVGSFFIVFTLFITSCFVWFGFAGQHWHEILCEEGYSPISARFWFGTNFNGQDIFARALYSTKTAFEIGLIVALSSVLLGVLLGSLAGFYRGRWVDSGIVWLFACLDSIPFYLLAASIALIFKDTRFGMHLAMIASLWTSSCRVMRAELIKVRNFEFVEAAFILGASDMRILFRHILPNLTPLILVEFTLSFVTAIKTEAVLSFLGLGVKEGLSWGMMLSEASSEIHAGEFHTFMAASLFMSVLVMAFNQLSDSLQDAMDPKVI